MGFIWVCYQQKGARLFIDQFENERINKQIDSMMSVMTINNRFNVYGLIKPLVYQDPDHGSDIQLAVKKHISIDPFVLLEEFSQNLQLIPKQIKEKFTQNFIEEFQE